MLYFKAPGFHIRSDSLAADWGEFVRYVEVADDQRAMRQVEEFTNGHWLGYDRDHWCDDFGQMVRHTFSRKPKWSVFFPEAEEIEASDFERAWRAAQRSPLRDQQNAASRTSQWGSF